MKFSFAFTFLVFSVFCFSLITATPESRNKRSVGLEKCPEGSTLESCTAYAKEKSKSMNYCHRFLAGDSTIEWQSCGSVSCNGYSKLGSEDLSKPYPECCRSCVDFSPSETEEKLRSEKLI